MRIEKKNMTGKIHSWIEDKILRSRLLKLDYVLLPININLTCAEGIYWEIYWSTCVNVFKLRKQFGTLF